MDDGNHQQRFLIRCISDQVIPDHLEPQRSGGQINSTMTLVGESNERSDCFKDFLAHSVGGIEAVGGYLLPDLV